jgi:AcrR family transcriptional regulator
MSADVSHGSKETTKEALLRAAKKVFAEKGFERATVKDIADEAGVNVSLVSYHYNGKENLFRECVQTYGEDRLASTERFLKTPTSVEDFRVRLSVYLDDYLQTALREPDTMMIMHRECIGQNPLTTDLFESLFMKGVKNLLRFFADAADKGYIAEGVDPHYAVLTVMGAIIHAIQMNPKHEKLFKLGLRDRAHREKIVETLVTMVVARPSTSHSRKHP